MRKRKLLSVLLSVAMIATLATGCGTKGNDNATSSGSVDLTVWASEEDQELTKDLIEKFKAANPDVKFNITVGAESESTAKDTILVDPTAGADVFAFASDQINDLVNAKVLQAVQDVEKVTNDNVASSIEAATVNETLYAYPMSADNGFFLYYDSSIVSEEQAKSWDGILTACSAAGKKAGMVMASGWYNAGFFYGAGFTTVLNADGGTTLDWAGTSKDGYNGTDVLQGMLDISSNAAFLPITDGDSANQIATGSLGAIISGTWDAAAVKEAFGEGYAATVLPTYTCADKQVQMASASGFKMEGVNANSKQVGWAMELAKFLTNEESQKERFEKREIGPSNKVVAASDEIAANVALAAVTNQNNLCGIVQTVGSKYWDATKSLGEIAAQGNPDGKTLQELLEATVKAAAQPSGE